MRIDKQLLRKSLLLTSADDVDTIIQPVKTMLHIDCFGYGRIYPDQTHISLCNNASWSELLYTEIFKHGMSSKSFESYTSAYGLWDDAKDQTSRKALFEHSHIKNGLTIIRKSEKYCELFNFSSVRNDATASYYMGQTDKLNLIADYFLSQATDLLDSAESDRNILPLCGKGIEQGNPFKLGSSNDFKSQESSKILEASNQVRQARLEIDIIQKLITKAGLSNREAELIHLIARGYTYKAVARQLSLEVATVHYYAERLKNKLGLHSKLSLCNFYWDFLSNHCIHNC